MNDFDRLKLNAYNDLTLERRFNRFSSWAGIAVTVIGGLVFISYPLHFTVLQNIDPTWVKMKPNTAFCFILAGLSLYCFARAVFKNPETPNKSQWVFQLFAGLVASIGGFTFLEEIFNIKTGIDQLFFQNQHYIPIYSSRMSYLASLCFTFFGVGILGSHSVLLHRKLYLSRMMGSSILLLTFIALISYSLRINELPTLGLLNTKVNMALPTMLCFLLLGSGLFCAQPETGAMQLLTSKTLGGYILRRLLPLCLIGIPLIRELATLGAQFGYYSLAFSIPITISSTLLIFTSLLFVISKKTSILDIERNQVEQASRENFQRFQAIFDQTFQFIGLLDTKGNVLEANRTAMAATGATPEEVLNKPFWLTPWWKHSTELQEQLKDAIHQARQGKLVRFEATHPAPDGQLLHVDFSLKPFYNKQGKVIYLIPEGRDITELKAMEASLRQSEEQFRTAMESTPVGMVIVSPKGRILKVNQAVANMLGYSREELLELDFQTLTHPDDLISEMELINKIINKEIFSYCLEKRCLHKDGTIVWALKSASLIRDENGEPLHFIAQLQNINRRKAMEQELRQSEAQFRSAMEYSGIGMALVSLDGHFIKVNKILTEIVGYSQEELLSLDFQTITHPDDLAADMDLLRRLLSQELNSYEMEKRYIHKSGRVVWSMLTVALLLDDIGQPLQLIAQLQDITHRKQIEQELAQSEERQRLITEKVKDYAIFMLDAKGYIQTWNTGAERIKGYTAEEVKGKHFSIFYTAEAIKAHFPEHELEQAAQNGSFEDEGWRVRKDGSCFWADTVITALYDENHELIGFSKVARDLTERKHAETQLEQAKVLAERSARLKSEFLANMSHEIRTPMNGILGMGEILMDTPLSDEQKNYLGMIHSSGESLLTILNDILDFSKIESGKMLIESYPFHLRQNIEELIFPFAEQARQKGLHLESRIDSSVPDLLVGDINRIRQIMLNLLSNAIKFTEDGHVLLAIEGSQQRTPSGQNCLALHLWVEDTGIGLSREQQQSVFDPFIQADSSTSRKYGGTGLGLSIVRQLVDLMEGRLWVESEPGHGTTFHVSFVLQFATEDPYWNRADNLTLNHPDVCWIDRAQVYQTTILLADDNQINKLVTIKMLEKLGYQIVSVDNGKQVLEQLETRHFDLILMDMLMPEMDGLEACQAIRTQECRPEDHIPIIMLTASAFKSDEQRCYRAGADDYMTKPFSRRVLDTRIRALLRRFSRKKHSYARATEVNNAYRGGSCLDKSHFHLENAHMPGLSPMLASPQVYDQSKIDLYMQLDEQLLAQMVDLFQQDVYAQISAVQDAIVAKDSHQLHQAAHDLKNSIGHFTEQGIYKLALQLENSARENNLSGLDKNLLPLKTGIEELIMALQKGVRREGTT